MGSQRVRHDWAHACTVLTSVRITSFTPFISACLFLTRWCHCPLRQKMALSLLQGQDDSLGKIQSGPLKQDHLWSMGHTEHSCSETESQSWLHSDPWKKWDGSIPGPDVSNMLNPRQPHCCPHNRLCLSWRPTLVLSWLVPLLESHASCFPSPLEPCWVTHWSTTRSELLMLIPGPSS